mmetsp:Transcript_77523/g.185916  ORF Transcript_77523/g.185916 Transcript_77523/m.185916 type:complete len:301 (-) Transcript_77523:435-1337(-)
MPRLHRGLRVEGHLKGLHADAPDPAEPREAENRGADGSRDAAQQGEDQVSGALCVGILVQEVVDQDEKLAEAVAHQGTQHPNADRNQHPHVLTKDAVHGASRNRILQVRRQRHLEEHLVPQKAAHHRSGHDGADQDDANHPGGQSGRHMLELLHGEEDPRERRVEGGGEAAAEAQGRQQRLGPRRPDAAGPADHPGEGRTDLDGRPIPTHGAAPHKVQGRDEDADQGAAQGDGNPRGHRQQRLHRAAPQHLLSHIIRCYMCNEPDAKHRDRGHQDVKHVFRDISFKEFLQDIALLLIVGT